MAQTSRSSPAIGGAVPTQCNIEYLWMADNTTGKVVKTTLEGELVMSIEKPDIEVYREGKYSPTGVAVYEERDGGNGDVYVTDGYGSNHVHRYDKDGEYISSINGEEGEAGAFATPHGVWIDTRKAERELYVADRSNGRIQVYDLARIHRRTSLGTALEEASGCSSESGIMVLEQKPARKQGAPNRCCHRTNPTVSASSLTTIAWWPMPACSCRPP